MLTVDAQRIDGGDKLLVHLHRPDDPGLLRGGALAIAVLAAHPLPRTVVSQQLLSFVFHSEVQAGPGGLRAHPQQQERLPQQWHPQVAQPTHPLIALALFVIAPGCIVVRILLRVLADGLQ